LKRNHDVTVLAHEHKGDQNGVKVSNDYNSILNQKWDLIVVHGGDVISQNIIHANAFAINKHSPVAYMIIKPSNSDVCKNGLKHHRFITYSTSADIDFLKNKNLLNKARRIRHGIVQKIQSSLKIKVTENQSLYQQVDSIHIRQWFLLRLHLKIQLLMANFIYMDMEKVRF
jgi:hypothetical protein